MNFLAHMDEKLVTRCNYCEGDECFTVI